MSDPNERPEATQEGDGQARDDTAGRVEATPAAERKAQEMDIDLASVEGTGSGGRITAADVENAQRRSDATEGPVETLRSDLSSRRDPKPPSLDDIQRQYVVLKALLAGPRNGAVPMEFINEDGVREEIRKGTFPNNPTNFFAPDPLRAELPADRVPVKWSLPSPQRLLPRSLPGTNQRCRREECLPDRIENG